MWIISMTHENVVSSARKISMGREVMTFYNWRCFL